MTYRVSFVTGLAPAPLLKPRNLRHMPHGSELSHCDFDLLGFFGVENERVRQREFWVFFVVVVVSRSFLISLSFSFLSFIYLSRVQRHPVGDAVNPWLVVHAGELVGAGSGAAVVAVVRALKEVFFF